jgi:hypothetical protein
LRTPAIVYVVGRAIDVNFDSGAVKRVTVRDDSLSTGLYLEPEKADTSAAGRRAAARRASAGAGAAQPGASGAPGTGDTRRAPTVPTRTPPRTTTTPSAPPRRP